MRYIKNFTKFITESKIEKESDLLILPKGTILFHGTSEKFDIYNLGTGGYDSLLWTVDNPGIAQTYISGNPDTYTSSNILSQPNRHNDSSVIKLQKSLGIVYKDVTKNSYKEADIFEDISDKYYDISDKMFKADIELDLYNKKGKDDDYIDSLSDDEVKEFFKKWEDAERISNEYTKMYKEFNLDAEKNKYVNIKLTELGYIPKDKDYNNNYSWRLYTDNDGILPAAHRNPGRLLIIETLKDLKILDFTWNETKESDLTDLDYHKHDWFEYAKSNGYDGVKIADFAQSIDFGNTPHYSIGFFKHAIKYLKLNETPAIHRELKDISKDPKMHTSEYKKYLGI